MKSIRPLTILMTVLLLWSLTVAALAQDSTEPPRETTRKAPPREPIILEQNGANTILQLPPLADTYIASERPNQNFGSDALFLGYNLVGGDNFGAERMLLRFDIANNIPGGAVINSAVLRLHLSFSSPTNDTPMGTVLRRLASPWSEFTVTWNTEPTWTMVDDTTFVGSELTWYEWEMTEVVENWYLETYPNDGLEIIGDETVQQRERAFYSRETPTQFFPQLVIDYTNLNDTQPPTVIVEALPTYSPRHFTVEWNGTDTGGSGIDYYDVQVRVDEGEWMDWVTGTTTTTAEYTQGENGRFYQFRARGVDNSGNVEPYSSAEASTTVDTLPPTVTVDPIAPNVTASTLITVSWSGTDNVSGIQYYDVQMRINNGSWSLWIPQTLATSAQFQAFADGFYAFEARAVDNLGLIEVFNNQAEATVIVDAEPPFIVPQVYLPLVVKP
jgi:hypothetical protein